MIIFINTTLSIYSPHRNKTRNKFLEIGADYENESRGYHGWRYGQSG